MVNNVAYNLNPVSQRKYFILDRKDLRLQFCKNRHKTTKINRM